MNIGEIMQSVPQGDARNKIRRSTRTYDKDKALAYFKNEGCKVCGNFDIDEDNREAISAMIAWLMNQPFTAIDPITKEKVPGRLDKGLYVYGGTGRGKTLAMQLLKTACRHEKMPLLFQHKYGTSELAWTTVRADDISEEFLDTGNVNRWIEERSLFIDDLGTEPIDMMYMGNRVNVLKKVIEGRGARSDQFTFFSSNLPLGQVNGVNPIRDRYGDRVESRIMEMCNYIYLGGDDRRIANAINK